MLFLRLVLSVFQPMAEVDAERILLEINVFIQTLLR